MPDQATRLPPAVRRCWPLALALLLTFGAGVAYLGWGLPAIWVPDEVSRWAWEMAQSGSLAPERFAYPTLHAYCILALVVAPLTWGHALVHAPAPTLAQVTYWARALSALMATGTVWLTYDIAVRLYDRTTAQLAALLLALSAGFVGLAHLATVDLPSIFWITAAFAACIRARGAHSVRGHLLAGGLAGLAMSAKYTGLLVVVPILVSLWVELRAGPAPGPSAGPRPVRPALRRWLAAVGLVAAVGVAFLIGTPYAALTPFRFLREFVDLNFYQTSYAGVGDRGFLPHLGNLLNLFGPFAFAAALAGTGYVTYRSIRQRNLGTGLLVLLVGVYYVKMGSMMFYPDRYIAMTLPFLALCGAAVLMAAVRAAGQRSPALARVAGAAIVAGLLSSAAYTAVGLNEIRTDDRVRARRWIAAHVPREAAIEIPAAYAPTIPPGYARVRVTPSWFRRAAIDRMYDDPRYLTVRAGLDWLDRRITGREPPPVGRPLVAGTVGEPEAVTLEALLERRPAYLVLARKWYGRFLSERAGNPERYPQQYRLYTAVLRGETPYELVANFEPRRRWYVPAFEFVHAGIRIYRDGGGGARAR